MKWREKPESVRPMLATLAEPPLTGRGLIYEPKYDGIRALVHIPPPDGRDHVRLWSRLGNDKTAQFPSIVRELEKLRAGLPAPLLVDSEIVALDEDAGEVAVTLKPERGESKRIPLTAVKEARLAFRFS